MCKEWTAVILESWLFAAFDSLFENIYLAREIQDKFKDLLKGNAVYIVMERCKELL